MRIGLEWDFSETDKASMDSFPFWVLLQNGEITLGKKISREFSGKRINTFIRLHTFAGVRDLFTSFYYSKHWYCHVTPKTACDVKHVVESIYFTKHKATWRYTPSQRYTLYRQFNRRPIQAPMGHKLAPFLDDLSDTDRLACRSNQIPRTYEEGLGKAALLDYELPDCDILLFANSDDVLWWALEQIVFKNQEISKCGICHSYFVRTVSKQMYCGKKCFQSSRAVGTFCADEEIKKVYMSTYQWFRRKTQSGKRYVYTAPSEEATLVRQLLPEEKREVPMEEICVTAADFKLMWEGFQEEYAEKYNRFKDAVLQQKDGNGNEETVEARRNELYEWIFNMKGELGLFRSE